MILYVFILFFLLGAATIILLVKFSLMFFNVKIFLTGKVCTSSCMNEMSAPDGPRRVKHSVPGLQRPWTESSGRFRGGSLSTALKALW